MQPCKLVGMHLPHLSQCHARYVNRNGYPAHIRTVCCYDVTKRIQK